jgi:hypothetical protein
MSDVLANAPVEVRSAAAKIADGEVLPQGDIDALLDVLTSAMLVSDNFDGNELTGRGVEIDALLGIVAQMSEDYFD